MISVTKSLVIHKQIIKTEFKGIFLNFRLVSMPLTIYELELITEFEDLGIRKLNLLK